MAGARSADFALHPVCGLFNVNGSVIVCGQTVVGLVGDDALAERIIELLNTHGLILPAAECEERT